MDFLLIITAATVWLDAVCIFVDCGLNVHRQCSVDSVLPKCTAATAATAADSLSQLHQLTFMPGESSYQLSGISPVNDTCVAVLCALLPA